MLKYKTDIIWYDLEVSTIKFEHVTGTFRFLSNISDGKCFCKMVAFKRNQRYKWMTSFFKYLTLLQIRLDKPSLFELIFSLKVIVSRL